VIAEVHNTYGQRHAYLLPPADLPVVTTKKFYVSPFFQVDGHYLIQAPRPDSEVDITVALHRHERSSVPDFTANLRGQRRPATIKEVAIMQIISPLARWWWPRVFGYRGSSCGYVEFQWCPDEPANQPRDYPNSLGGSRFRPLASGR